MTDWPDIPTGMSSEFYHKVLQRMRRGAPSFIREDGQAMTEEEWLAAYRNWLGGDTTTATSDVTAATETGGPLGYYRTLTEKGMFTPAQIEAMAGEQAAGYGEGVRGLRQQAVDRSAAMGYQQPWLSGGDYTGGQTLGGIKAAAGARSAAQLQNELSKLQGAEGWANLAGLLAQLEMQPTAPAGNPMGDFMGQFNDWMKQLKDALAQGAPPPAPPSATVVPGRVAESARMIGPRPAIAGTSGPAPTSGIFGPQATGYRSRSRSGVGGAPLRSIPSRGTGSTASSGGLFATFGANPERERLLGRFRRGL